MDALKIALREQYHAALAMLSECVLKCPDDLWSEARPDFDHRPVRRDFWRIAFHAAYGTHLMLGQTEDAYRQWPGHRTELGALVNPTADVDPYELADSTEPYSQQELQGYIAYVDSLIHPTIDQLDLTSKETGFPLYPSMSKLSHNLMALRHLQGHVGQLSELLILRGIDIEWVSGGKPSTDANG